MDRCDLIRYGWRINPYMFPEFRERLGDTKALEAIENICQKLINQKENEEVISTLPELVRKIQEMGLYERIISTLYALLLGLTVESGISYHRRNLVCREYRPKELKHLEVVFPRSFQREPYTGLDTGGFLQIASAKETRIKYVSPPSEGGTFHEVVNNNVIKDKIIVDGRHSGTAVFMYDTLSSKISVSNELSSLIVEGYGITIIDGIKVAYMELLGYPLTIVNNVSSSITLLYSRIAPYVEINLIPIDIEEINLKQLIKRIHEKSTEYSSIGTIFSDIASIHKDIEQLCNYPEEVDKDAIEYIQSQLSRKLKIAILELEVDAILGKTVISVPEDSLIVLAWKCYDGQKIMIDNEVIECSREGIFGKDALQPKDKIARSIVFIHLSYPAGRNVIIRRRSVENR